MNQLIMFVNILQLHRKVKYDKNIPIQQIKQNQYKTKQKFNRILQTKRVRTHLVK